AQALARRAAEGLPVRLHLPPGAPSIPGATVVATPSPGGLVAVADGTSVLLAPGLGDAPDGAVEEGEWAVWSTRPGMAALLGPAFEAACPSAPDTPVIMQRAGPSGDWAEESRPEGQSRELPAGTARS
ncbi:MAG TPA: hypothetical protein VHI93_00040, partial [Candidatus Thermoplasmatota archaeon]|nr:hypothetical protein [Candidatus Thermoplasmatota archaeon]